MTKTLQDYYKDLGQAESSGRYNIENKYGYLGKYQMGVQALEQAEYYTMSKEEREQEGKVNMWNGTFNKEKGITSKEDYLNNAEAQEDSACKYNESQWRQIIGKGGDKYIGKTINGIVITPSGLLAAAHLKGPAGSSEYYKSNGKKIPHDGNGTTVEERMFEFRDYDVSKITGIPHKEYDTFECYLKNKDKEYLLEGVSSIQDRKKKEFDGNKEPEFVKRANTWNKEIKKEASEYRKNQKNVEDGINKRKEQIKKGIYTGGAASANNSFETNPIRNNSSGFENVSIDGKRWKDLDDKTKEAFTEGFDLNAFTKDGIRKAKIDKDWTKKFNVGNPDNDKGHWVTMPNGKHLFIKDEVL